MKKTTTGNQIDKITRLIELTLCDVTSLGREEEEEEEKEEGIFIKYLLNDSDAMAGIRWF